MLCPVYLVLYAMLCFVEVEQMQSCQAWPWRVSRRVTGKPTPRTRRNFCIALCNVYNSRIPLLYAIHCTEVHRELYSTYTCILLRFYLYMLKLIFTMLSVLFMIRLVHLYASCVPTQVERGSGVRIMLYYVITHVCV